MHKYLGERERERERERESNSSGLALIFFETGSQRSYVTNDTHNRLNLLIIRKEKLVIQTFGQHESKLENVDIA